MSFDFENFGKTPETSIDGQKYSDINQTELLKNNVGNVGNFAIGAGKELASYPFQVGKFIANAGTSIAKTVTGNKNIQTNIPQVPDILKPQGGAQQLGATTTDIGAMLWPTGIESKISSKLAEIPELAKNSPLVTKITQSLMKGSIKGLGSAAEYGAKTYLETGDMNQAKSAAELGFIYGPMSQSLEDFGPGLTKSLIKSGFKLSPSQEMKAAGKVDKASEFMANNKILGPDEGKYKKLVGLTNNLETTLQTSLPKGAVSKKQVIDEINNTISSLKEKDPAKYISAKKDAQEAIDLLNSTKGDTISIENALNSKRSYGTQAFKQSKFNDPKVVSEGQYAVEQAFQRTLENTLEQMKSTIKIPKSMQSYFGGKAEVSLSDFNKVYSNAINSKNLTNLARFKNDTHLIGRMFGLWAGQAVGQVVSPGLGGQIIGGVTGEVLSNKIPSTVRNIGENVFSTNPKNIYRTGSVYQGIKNSNK